MLIYEKAYTVIKSNGDYNFDRTEPDELYVRG